MSWLEADADPIVEGWGPAPHFEAPNLSGTLAAILHNRQVQQALTQKNISEAIKNIQSQREEQAYTDALQKAGLLPEGDYGGLGIKSGSSLAGLLQRKQALDALAAHRTAMEARIGGRGSGSGVDEDTQVETPAGYYGLSVAPGAPSKETTRVINGIVHVRTAKGGWKPAPKWMQGQGSGTGTPKLSPTERGWAAPEIPGLSVNINAPDEPAQTLQPDVPPMPADDTGAPPPADKNLAPGYGTKATYMKAPDGTVSPVDPNLVEYYKSKGAVVVAGP